MRILFIGTVEISYYTLKSLISIEAEIVGVITKQKSDFNSDFYDLSPLCKMNNIFFKYVRNINHENNINWIKNQNPDIIFCLGWSQILSSEILNIPTLGVVGYHPAKLPYNKGRHPLIWALILGLKETASSFFFMDEGADTGDIISQKNIEIFETDNAGSLYKKMIDIGCKQVVEVYKSIKSGHCIRQPQDKSEGNSWRKRTFADGKIDWRMSAYNINNLVRGLTRPYPGAHFEYNGENITVWKTSVLDLGEQYIEPGKILNSSTKQIVVKCGEGAIAIENCDPQIEVQVGDYL